MIKIIYIPVRQVKQSGAIKTQIAWHVMSVVCQQELTTSNVASSQLKMHLNVRLHVGVCVPVEAPGRGHNIFRGHEAPATNVRRVRGPLNRNNPRIFIDLK